MANLDRAMPSWINKWLVINSLILFMDGGFCVLRPHSLPDGCLGSTVFYGYKWYIAADKHYADTSDSFIFTQGFGNLVEAVIGVLIVMNVFRTVRLTKLVTMFVSVMTAYKTVLFCLYSLDIGQGGRTVESWWSEFMVFGFGLIWLVVPKYVVWLLIQDFLDIKPKSKSSTSLSTAKTTSTSYDSVDSRFVSPPPKTVLSQRKNKKIETPAQRTSPSERYNFRDRKN